MILKHTTRAGLGRALFIAAAVCWGLSVGPAALFGQSFLAIQGPLPTPALPPGLLSPAVQAAGATAAAARPAVAGDSPLTVTGLASASSGASRGSTAAEAPGAANPAAPAIRSAAPGSIPDQIGYASWYGTRFSGRLTASGEIYNMHALTAANLTLPFGTKVLVTNLANGRSVEVTINDRGPYVAGRIIDLSQAAAEAIGLTAQGVAKVRLHVLALGNGMRYPAIAAASGAPGSGEPAGPGQAASGAPKPAAAQPASPSLAVQSGTAAGSAASQPPAPQPAPTSVVVQVGAFRQLSNAIRLKDFLAAKGFDPIYEKFENFTRVVLLPVPETDLSALRQRLAQVGITSILLHQN